MATPEIVEVPAEEETQDTLSPEALEESLKPSEAESTQEPQVATEEDVPEKYKGKSVKEVIAMHQQAESVIGRHSGEVGELRGIVDEFITKQTTVPKEPAAPEAPKVDFFEDPETAVSQAIANHPDVVAARDSAKNMERQTAASKISEKHPDAATVVADPEFAKFVAADPIRQELFARADKNNDFAAADNLLTSFKSRASVVQKTADSEAEARKESLKTASTGSTGGATGGSGKKVYRRADIIRLMRDHPDRYDALAPEIDLAYKEGRVR